MFVRLEKSTLYGVDRIVVSRTVQTTSRSCSKDRSSGGEKAKRRYRTVGAKSNRQGLGLGRSGGAVGPKVLLLSAVKSKTPRMHARVFQASAEDVRCSVSVAFIMV